MMQNCFGRVSHPTTSSPDELKLQDFHLQCDGMQILKVWNKKLFFFYVIQKLFNQKDVNEKILPSLKGYFSLLEESPSWRSLQLFIFKCCTKMLT